MDLGVERLGLMDLIRCKVLQGVLREAQCHADQKAFRRFRVNETEMIELAIAAAETYRRLGAAGELFNKRVIWFITTFCLVEGYAMLPHDEDYDPFKGYSL